MSHFSVLVLVPEKTKDVQKYVEKVLAPYSEAKKVKQYDADCNCIGEKARDEVREAANKKFGTMDAFRTRFHEENAALSKKVDELRMACYKAKGVDKQERENRGKAFEEADKEIDKLWKAAMAPRTTFEKETLAKHRGRKKPNPECGFYTQDLLERMRKDYPQEKKYERLKPGDRFEDESGCAGTGKYPTRYNPKSKWDWFTIGGRWTGALVPSYDPESDPANIQTCGICRGTGLRMDELGINERKQDPEYTCNGCNGEGKHAKWPTDWKKFDGDVMPTKLVPKDFSPFAIVTPDGEWHEHGKMHYWAVVSDEDEGWPEKAKAIINDFRKTTIAVICDCHI